VRGSYLREPLQTAALIHGGLPEGMVKVNERCDEGVDKFFFSLQPECTLTLEYTPVKSSDSAKLLFATHGNDGVSSLPVQFTIAIDLIRPVISEVLPLNLPTNGGDRVTIRGTVFNPDNNISNGPLTGIAHSFARVNGEECTNAVKISDSEVQCDLPAGQGAEAKILLSLAGAVSRTWDYSYAAPVINAVTSFDGLAMDKRVTLTGSNFGVRGAGQTVKLGRGIPCYVQVRSATPCDVLSCCAFT
jgi:hypothetical protein